MPDYSLPYGRKQVPFTIPDRYPVDLILPAPVAPLDDPLSAVVAALEHPLGAFRYEDFQGARSAAIAVNDKTRPSPNQELLPPLLARLERLGIPRADTHLLIASGTHQPMSREEFSLILPQNILDAYPVTAHDCDAQANLEYLGQTSSGTPIWVNRDYLQADLRIVTGNIEPHHFMGFSGGAKGVSIGLTGRETINRNHAFLSHPDARTAVYAENPMRQDVEEIGERIGIHLAVNTVLTPDKLIVDVLAGSPRAVMEAGIPLARRVCQVQTAGGYDLVIASPGGYPKDINFYQAQKGLTHAAMLARDGGTVVLAAACPEGPGSKPYMDWMAGLTSGTEVFEKFAREGFRVGPHKAYQVARIASRVKVILVSDMSAETVQRMLLASSPNLESAVGQALSELPAAARIAVLPRAVTTIPDINPHSTVE